GSRSFIIDGIAPTAFINFPFNTIVYNATGWTDAITGTAADTGGSNLQKVEVSIRDTTTGNWWGGSAFDQTREVYVPASGTGNWSLSFPDSRLTDGHSYLVHARATDNAGNVSTVASKSFTYDTTAPDAPVMISPVDGPSYSSNAQVGLFGTA